MKKTQFILFAVFLFCFACTQEKTTNKSTQVEAENALDTIYLDSSKQKYCIGMSNFITKTCFQLGANQKISQIVSYYNEDIYEIKTFNSSGNLFAIRNYKTPHHNDVLDEYLEFDTISNSIHLEKSFYIKTALLQTEADSLLIEFQLITTNYKKLEMVINQDTTIIDSPEKFTHKFLKPKTSNEFTFFEFYSYSSKARIRLPFEKTIIYDEEQKKHLIF